MGGETPWLIDLGRLEFPGGSRESKLRIVFLFFGWLRKKARLGNLGKYTLLFALV